MDELNHDDDYLLGLEDQTDASRTPSLRGGGGASEGNSDVDTNMPANWLSFVLFVSILFVAALLTRLAVQLFWKGKDKILPMGNAKSFHHAVAEAKRGPRADTTTSCSQTSSASSVNSSPPPKVIYKTYDGDFYKSSVKEKGYRCRKHDAGKSRSGFVKVHLTNNGTDGYDISGMCADSHGCATITEGHVSYSGYAWWVQEILEEDEERLGLKVLSRGKFITRADVDDDEITIQELNSNDTTRGESWSAFEGTWVTNEGTHGRYSKFEAKNVMAMVDIPVVAIVPEPATPVLSK